MLRFPFASAHYHQVLLFCREAMAQSQVLSSIGGKDRAVESTQNGELSSPSSLRLFTPAPLGICRTTRYPTVATPYIVISDYLHPT